MRPAGTESHPLQQCEPAGVIMLVVEFRSPCEIRPPVCAPGNQRPTPPGRFASVDLMHDKG